MNDYWQIMHCYLTFTACADSDLDLSETVNVSDTDSDPTFCWWIEALRLYESDKDLLLSDSELNDSIIDAAHTILSQQFPSMGGFRCFLATILTLNLFQEKFQASRYFIQVYIHAIG